MRSWLPNPVQFGGNLRGVWYLVYPNSSMWSGLEAFIPLNLSTQEVRVLTSWNNLDLFGGGRRGNTSEVGGEDRGSAQFSALGVSEAEGQASILCILSTVLLPRGSLGSHSSLFGRVDKGSGIDEEVKAKKSAGDVLRSQRY